MIRRVSVSITIEDRKVTLEGPEDFVREEVERLATGSIAAPKAPQADNAPNRIEIAANAGPATERELIQEKRPRGHSETVAVLAHCLTINGQREFTADDMRRAYLRASVRPPKVIAQALRDAKNTADFLERGGARGTFRLSPHGERTVLFDMPRREVNQK